MNGGFIEFRVEDWGPELDVYSDLTLQLNGTYFTLGFVGLNRVWGFGFLFLVASSN